MGNFKALCNKRQKVFLLSHPSTTALTRYRAHNQCEKRKILECENFPLIQYWKQRYCVEHFLAWYAGVCALMRCDGYVGWSKMLMLCCWNFLAHFLAAAKENLHKNFTSIPNGGGCGQKKSFYWCLLWWFIASK